MPDTPFVVGQFGGLNVIADPEEVGSQAAVSLLNVDTDQRGAVRARDGYSNFTASAGANPYRSLYWHAAGQLIGVRAGSGNDVIEAFDSGGSVVTSVSGSVPGGQSGTASFATIGTPSSTFTYIAISGFGGVKTFDGSAFASATFSGSGTPPAAGSLLAAWKERLVHELAGSVWFSNAGDSTTFPTNNFVIPDAGDAETSFALLTWGDYLVLIRQTKMFVFYGVSVDSTGNPVFNYRREIFGDLGSMQSVAVAPDGIYLLTTKGLYKTVGGPMVQVSEQPRGIFGNLLSRTSPSGWPRLPSVAFQNRLYFAASSSGSNFDRTLVFDVVTGDWLLWDIAAQSLATSRFTGAGSFVVFGVPSKHIGKLDSSVTTDAGSSISWNYTSGLYDLSGNNRIATTRESSMWGVGTVTLQVANDHGSLDTGSSVTLGSSPAVAQGWQQIDREGVFWQHKLSGAAWGQVNRLEHYVSFVRGSDQGN